MRAHMSCHFLHPRERDPGKFLNLVLLGYVCYCEANLVLATLLVSDQFCQNEEIVEVRREMYSCSLWCRFCNGRQRLGDCMKDMDVNETFDFVLLKWCYGKDVVAVS